MAGRSYTSAYDLRRIFWTGGDRDGYLGVRVSAAWVSGRFHTVDCMVIVSYTACDWHHLSLVAL